MKLVNLTIAAAVCCAVSATSTLAQQLQYPATIRPASAADFFGLFDDEDEGDVIESPSDVVPVPVDEPAVTDRGGKCDPCDGKDSKAGCKGGCCGPRFGSRLAGLGGCMCAGDPWRLWPMIAPCAAECRGIDVGGWMQIGYYTEGTNRGVMVPAGSPILPGATLTGGTNLFNRYPNVVQLQQAWLYAEKAIDDDRCSVWDWGFRADYVYGTDGPTTQAFGGRDWEWDNDWNNGNFYGHAIPQLYAEVAYNDLKIKAGHFYTICGYEVVPAPDNFFYSHAFTMVLAEPFTHTGVLAEYALTDNITVWGGWTAGWDTGFTRNYGDVFLGGFSLQLTESLAFTYTTTMGNFGLGAGGSDDDAYSHSIVVDWAITDRLNYVFQTDYVDNDLLYGVDNRASGVNQYLFYQINDCVGVGGRYEYFQIGDVYINSVTLGMNIKPHPNLILRPEVRWDDFDPVINPLVRDSTVFGVDMIFTF